MVGNLSATIHLDNGDITRQQNVLGLARLPLGKHPGMLQTPELINRGFVPVGGEGFHGLPGFQIGLLTQRADDKVRHQSTMWTRPLAFRSSNSALSWASPVARMCSCTDEKRPLLLSFTDTSDSSIPGACCSATATTNSLKSGAASPITLIMYLQGNSIFGAFGSLMPRYSRALALIVPAAQLNS